MRYAGFEIKNVLISQSEIKGSLDSPDYCIGLV